jgi:hypothetical protein
MVADEGVLVECVDSLDRFYDLGRTVGRGEFAKVKLAQCKGSGNVVRSLKVDW